MQQAPNARAFLRRLHPWIGKAVHVRWTLRRSFYQSEINALLIALGGAGGRMPHDVSLRLQGLLGRLYREWFPRTWRRDPTYAEILADFRWWLGVAQRWSEPPPKARRGRRAVYEPLAAQPKPPLPMPGLRRGKTATQSIPRSRPRMTAHQPV